MDMGIDEAGEYSTPPQVDHPRILGRACLRVGAKWNMRRVERADGDDEAGRGGDGDELVGQEGERLGVEEPAGVDSEQTMIVTAIGRRRLVEVCRVHVRVAFRRADVGFDFAAFDAFDFGARGPMSCSVDGTHISNVRCRFFLSHRQAKQDRIGQG